MKADRIPYIYTRTPSWSETDAAQIIYTVKFVDYAMEAIEYWFRDVFGLDWFTMNTEKDMGTLLLELLLRMIKTSSGWRLCGPLFRC